ncbi:UDP-N-acetylenolpyruvoylglucosamine reductase [Tepidanaerobacter syntrophicus]|nr:UDP-N-acetylenolpyruvoylglucosamine reductase [Tepidanaerobacter syntrophicus]GLI52014.1 UDP-N-acetylenolpyruvoylglucosamine reductase [Tepidanaerobacter syntrophicus]
MLLRFFKITDKAIKKFDFICKEGINRTIIEVIINNYFTLDNIKARSKDMDSIKIVEILNKILKPDQIKINEPMKYHTSFRIGGPCDIMVLPEDEEDVLEVIKICAQNSIPFFIMGNGTNLLVKDGGIRGVVIKLAQNFSEAVVDKDVIRCKAGLPLSNLSKLALENSLKGLEFAGGIPGTVGGAVVMNAGAYDGQMAEIVESVKVMEQDGDIYEIKNKELGYSYRTSVLQNSGKIVLEALIKLEPGSYGEIKSRMEKYSVLRRQKQPLNLPSAGSVFKRPPGNFAGALIEKAGLKGYKIGGAMVSEKHAGFIVNTGGATARDVIELIEYIQQEVQRKFDVLLEPEIKIIGEDELE